ncbi:MAG: hypothetical protein UFR15_07870 [Succiniclasticum sp.]|nr:hypothetical protein [Succiniclasticum sp.]
MITLFFLEFLVLKALFYVFILALVALFVFVCVGGACAMSVSNILGKLIRWVYIKIAKYRFRKKEEENS